MTTEEPISFTGYWNAVDEAMLKLFAVDTTATGIGPDAGGFRNLVRRKIRPQQLSPGGRL
jgi:hypothetical protein